ncbi:hypothetical protein DFH11DRAFT_727843 [Phellopilus nigrolimitatus]|nr:hypothetical protein DFH11DRAFT_727843 [Phellopilus nigrolimitatus]
MHLSATAALTALSALSFACGARLQDSTQAVLSQDEPWAQSADYLEDYDGVAEIRGAVHPLPPHRGAGSDPWNLSSFTNTTFHDAYHPLYEIDEFMEHLAALYPDRVTLFELGHSAQGREMFAMRITSGALPNAEDGPKKGFVITGAQHAREWVASAAALYMAHALVSNASEHNSMARLLDDFDFHIVPSPNPDGYVFTWENDRLWYKNRMPVGPDEPCQGLDMNRNWGFHWSPSDAPEQLVDPDALKKKKKKGKKPKTPTAPAPAPADPCSHWYPGHRPFEAPEVNNIANYVTQTPALAAFLDLRNYGQMLSWPYSFACNTLPPDAEDLFEAALGAAHAVRKKHGTIYTTGSLCSTLYPAPGNILDWMYGTAGIKFAYAAHLRDTGTYGYALPREWIRPVGEETATMVEYLASFVSKKQKY